VLHGTAVCNASAGTRSEISANVKTRLHREQRTFVTTEETFESDWRENHCKDCEMNIWFAGQQPAKPIWRDDIRKFATLQARFELIWFRAHHALELCFGHWTRYGIELNRLLL
jgi:hypothetical protein